MDTFNDAEVKEVVINFCTRIKDLYLTNNTDKIQQTKDSITKLFDLIIETIKIEQTVEKKNKETNPAIIKIIESFL